MNEDEFLTSSDSVRGAAPLTHAQTVTFEEPLELALGGRLPEVTVVYETYGALREAKDNAVLICHALSGDSHVARHDEADEAGWWDVMVGPSRPIDTDRLFVICPNILGGCRGTTGPNSINPETARPYGQDFPTITIADMVEVQHRLLRHLGIRKLLAVLGGSMGGQQALCWAQRYPAYVAGVIPIAASPRLTSQAMAFDVVGRNAILRDPNYRGGQYYDGGPAPDVGLAIARMIGHITYLSREAMEQKFDTDRLRPRQILTEFERKFSVGSYLGYQGDRFVERFDANSYLTLSMAMDLFDLGATREQVTAALNFSLCRWLVLSYTSDWLFPAEQSRELVDALIATNKPVSYCNVTSSCGHDAFLLPDDLHSYGELIRAFLRNLLGDPVPAGPPGGDADAHGTNPASIFHARRLDYDRILELIPGGSSVLDMGCGSGGLMARLKQRGHQRIMGVERDEQAILACVRRGLDIIQIDLNEGLGSFADKQFDCVVLSQTLQAVQDVAAVVDELLRVGRWGIVSFPNFAYHKLRAVLAEEGRAPRTAGLLHHEWYDTPNIRFFSIRDFEEFCTDRGIVVHRRVAINTESGTDVAEDPNRNADLAIFVISR
ncbi:MAG TPA: homoserine O-acetyltransferase [Phycisphaerae bacterium]|nr:homoserine O-acetyltransferase [Phycisphaerae bacterium]